MAFVLKDGQKVRGVAANATDADGNPITDGPPAAWSSSDETLVTVAPDADAADGSQVVTTAPGPGLGTATVTAVVTMPDGSSLTAVQDFQVVAGDEAFVNISVGGTPEPR